MLGASLTTALAATTCMPESAYNACVASQATLETTIATLKSQVSEYTIKLKGDQSDEKSLLADIKTAETSAKNLNTKIASLNDEVTKLNGEISNPKTTPEQKAKDETTLIEVQAQIATDTDLVAGLNAEVTSYNGQLTPIEADISTQEAAISAANATIATDQAALKALKCVLCAVSPT